MTDRGSSFVAAITMAAMFAVGVAFGIALDHRVLHRRPTRVAFGGDGERGRMPFMVPPVLPGVWRLSRYRQCPATCDNARVTPHS